MTRGMRGCYIYYEDNGLEKYFLKEVSKKQSQTKIHIKKA